VTLSEVGDRAKIGRVVRDDHHEIDPLDAWTADAGWQVDNSPQNPCRTCDNRQGSASCAAAKD
jgi:hypothetical protein